MKKKEMTESRQTTLMLGYLCIADVEESNLTRKVEILDKFSFSDDDISTICGCKYDSVRDARRRLKKGSKKK